MKLICNVLISCDLQCGSSLLSSGSAATQSAIISSEVLVNKLISICRGAEGGDRNSDGGGGSGRGSSGGISQPTVLLQSQAFAAAALGNLMLHHSLLDPWAKGKGIIGALAMLIRAPLPPSHQPPPRRWGEEMLLLQLSVATSAAGSLQNFVAMAADRGWAPKEAQEPRGNGDNGFEDGSDLVEILESVIALIAGAERIHQVNRITPS